jgi:hypothetical protein
LSDVVVPDSLPAHCVACLEQVKSRNKHTAPAQGGEGRRE